MKKILATLGSIVIASTGSSSIMSMSKNVQVKMVNNLIDLSSITIKSAEINLNSSEGSDYTVKEISNLVFSGLLK